MELLSIHFSYQMSSGDSGTRAEPELRNDEDFVKFIFSETSLKFFNLIYIKPKEEAGHRINHQGLWWQLLFVLNVLSSSGSRKIVRHAVQRNNERSDFQALLKSNSDLIAVVRAPTMRAFIALFQTFSCLIFLMNSRPRETARAAIRKR